MVNVRIRVRGRASFRVRVRLGLELGLRNWPNTQRVCLNSQRVWSNAQIDQNARPKEPITWAALPVRQARQLPYHFRERYGKTRFCRTIF